MTFKNLVDEILSLSLEDKESLKELIDKYLIDEKREVIYRSFEGAKRELQERRLKFSSDLNELKEDLEK